MGYFPHYLIRVSIRTLTRFFISLIEKLYLIFSDISNKQNRYILQFNKRVYMKIIADTELLDHFHLEEVKRALSAVTRILERWNYTFTQAKVYAILLLSPKPLTINEIADIANLSRSTISTVLSRLSDDYLVHYSMKGKVKYYVAIPSITNIFIRQPKEILEKEIKPLKEVMRKIASKKSNGNHYKYVLEDIENICDKLQKCIQIFEK